MKSGFAWTFQGGKIIVKTITATAGNVTTNLSPGTGKRWLILRGRITLVTDATVATRHIDISITDGTNITEFISAVDVTASLTRMMNLGEAVVVKTATLGGGTDQSYCGIQSLLIEGSDQLRIQVAAGVAGDSYSGYVVVLEIDV